MVLSGVVIHTTRGAVPVNERRKTAVLRLLRREESGAAIARWYGIGATVYGGRDEFIAAGEGAPARGVRDGTTSNDRRIAELERQAESHDQLIGKLTIANRERKLAVDLRSVSEDQHFVGIFADRFFLSAYNVPAVCS